MKPGSKFSLLYPPLLCLVTHSFTHSLQGCQHLPLILALQCSTNLHTNVHHWKSSPFYHFFLTITGSFQIHVLVSSEHSSLILNPQKHPTVHLLETLTRLQICSMNPSLHLQAHHVNLPCSSNPSKPIQKPAPPSYCALYLKLQILL